MRSVLIRRLVLVLSTLIVVVGAVALPFSGQDLRSTRVPPHEAFPVALSFATPTLGFAVNATQAGRDRPVATILRTSDGGRTWSPVWTGAGVILGSVTTVGGRVVASGSVVEADGSYGPPVLVSGRSAGGGWTVTTPVVRGGDDPMVGPFVGDRLQFADASTGVSLPDAEDVAFHGPSLITRDGGRTWQAFTVSGRPVAAVAFPLVDHWIAAVEGVSGDALWSSTSSGSRWTLVPGTTEPFDLTAVSFATPLVGYAGGGFVVASGRRPHRAVLATLDGGRTWTVTWSSGGPGGDDGGGPVTALAFTGPHVGLALAGTCAHGQPGPCSGPLWRTTDGGRTWSRAAIDGYAIQAVEPGDLWVLTGRSGGAAGVPELSMDQGASWVSLRTP